MAAWSGGLSQAADGVISANIKTPGFADLFEDVSSKFSGRNELSEFHAYKFGKMVFIYMKGGDKVRITIDRSLLPDDFSSYGNNVRAYVSKGSYPVCVYDEYNSDSFYFSAGSSSWHGSVSFFYFIA